MNEGNHMNRMDSGHMNGMDGDVGMVPPPSIFNHRHMMMLMTFFWGKTPRFYSPAGWDTTSTRKLKSPICGAASNPNVSYEGWFGLHGDAGRDVFQRRRRRGVIDDGDQ
ncbi:Hypothetical predicted protein [Olea europaea subsp. europaea]|uniref:Uncharacterized protein n=1 Tax=Olea europaea subsp. europaea TaxID=158383 RepID=A0A8S0RJC8_OLEEU|nr:Hypothetical predicted protein [Olea europaea subsp. europaea]